MFCCTCCPETPSRRIAPKRCWPGADTISVQVLNEFAAVASRKLGLSYAEIREVLEPVRAVCAVEPITPETHDLGLQIAERYGFALYDALIVAAALLAGCGTLHSEDLQDGQSIDGRLVVRNPFAARSSEPGERASAP